MTINLFYVDVVILSMLLSVVSLLGNGIKENLVIAFIVAICGVYSIFKYFWTQSYHNFFKRKALIVWMVMFYFVYFVYGNFYHAKIDPLGGNDAFAVFLLSALDVFFLITPYENKRMLKLIEFSFFISLVVYFVFFIALLSTMSMEELILYRLGDQINGESVVKGDSNTVAMNIVFLSLFVFANVFILKKAKYILPLLLIIAIVLFTGSKAGIFSVIIYIFVFNFVQCQLSLKKIATTITMVVLLFYLILENEYLYLLIGHRIEDFLGMFGVLENTEYSNSTTIRLMMNNIGINMWLDNPIFGNGRAAFRGYSGFYTWSHNNYIEILSSFGLLGLLVNYWYPIVLTIKSFIMRKSDDIGISIVFAYYTASFFIDIAAVRYALYMTPIMVVITGILINNAENKT